MNREMLEFLFVGPLFSIFRKLNNIERRLQDMATQADVDALVQRVNSVATQQQKALGEIQSEVQSLKDQIAAGAEAANLDLSGLDAAVAGAAEGAQQLDDVVPDAPVEGSSEGDTGTTDTTGADETGTETNAPSPADPTL